MKGPDTELSAGERVADRFVLDRPIGVGGFASVWLASRSDGDGAKVAIKFLDPAVAVDASSVRRFTEEAETLERLQHPAIARILGATMHGRRHALIMEYVPGKTLFREFAARAQEARPFSIDEALTPLCDLLGALGHAHERSIVHRDVKPANVILRKKGASSIALLDFGVAKLLDASPLDATTAGRVIGTQSYMAPEQFTAKPVSVETDLFAVGVILFEALTLRRLWLRTDDGHPAPMTAREVVGSAMNQYAAVMMRICREPRIRLGMYREVPEWLEAVFQRAIHADREQRFRSADEMARALLAPRPINVMEPPMLPANAAPFVAVESETVREDGMRPWMIAAEPEVEQTPSGPSTDPDAAPVEVPTPVAMPALQPVEMLPALPLRDWTAVDGGSFEDQPALSKKELAAPNPLLRDPALAEKALAHPPAKSSSEAATGRTVLLPAASVEPAASLRRAKQRSLVLILVCGLGGASAGVWGLPVAAAGVGVGVLLALVLLRGVAWARAQSLVAAIAESKSFVWPGPWKASRRGTTFKGLARPLARSGTKVDPELTLVVRAPTFWLGEHDAVLVEVEADRSLNASVAYLLRRRSKVDPFAHTVTLAELLKEIEPSAVRLSPRHFEQYAQNLARCGGGTIKIGRASLSCELRFRAKDRAHTPDDLHEACGFLAALTVWCAMLSEPREG